jgi:hypothetical protein
VDQLLSPVLHFPSRALSSLPATNTNPSAIAVELDEHRRR